MCRSLTCGGRRCNGGDRGNAYRRIQYAVVCSDHALDEGRGDRLGHYAKKITKHRNRLREDFGEDHLPEPLPEGATVEAARLLATHAHAGQVRRDGRPYIVHPEDVADRLARCGFPAPVVAAAWLHDVPEDTAYTLDDLRSARFPAKTVDTVGCVTHEPGESYVGDSMPRAVTTLDSAALKDADNQNNTSDRLGPTPKEYARQIARNEKYLAARRQIKARLYETPDGQAELEAQFAERDRLASVR